MKMQKPTMQLVGIPIQELWNKDLSRVLFFCRNYLTRPEICGIIMGWWGGIGTRQRRVA